MEVLFNNERAWQILEEVKDPEIPVISVVELGVVRNVETDGKKVMVTITPTYSGCPAMHMMEEDIIKALKENGAERVEVKTVLAPAWTTAWITDEAKKKLENYGIAPPAEESADKAALLGKTRQLKCPQCGSKNTVMKSQFGSTACKALFVCNDCLEPFDYFKCL